MQTIHRGWVLFGVLAFTVNIALAKPKPKRDPNAKKKDHVAETNPKPKGTVPPGSVQPITPPKSGPLDFMAIAKALSTEKADDPKFGEEYGLPSAKNPQARMYQTGDGRISEMIVVLQANKPGAMGVAFKVNNKSPLTLREVEKVFGTSTEMKTNDAPGFTGYTFPKIQGLHSVEPVVYMSKSASEVKKTDPVFQLLLRRSTP